MCLKRKTFTFNIPVKDNILGSLPVSAFVQQGSKMEAMQKFWMTEDLLEHFLPMLDLPSTLALASISSLTLSLIKRPLLWQQLLQSSWQLFVKDFYNVDLMVDLLKLMEDPEPLLLTFLEHICHFHLLGLMGVKGEILLHLGPDYKVVDPICFMLMQYVVASMGSKVMVVEGIHLEYFGGQVGRALASQASQQQQEVRWVRLRGLTFNQVDGQQTRTDKSCISLLQNCSNWSVNGLYLHSIGESVWRSLAEASTKGEIKFVEVNREALVLGRPADVRKIWQATRSYWRIIGLTDLIEKEGEGEGEEEEGWTKIQEILEMEDRDWKALSLIRWW